MRTLKVEGSPRLLMTLARPGVAKDAGRCVVEEPVMDKVLEIALALGLDFRWKKSGGPSASLRETSRRTPKGDKCEQAVVRRFGSFVPLP